MAKGYGLAGQIDTYLKGKGSPLSGYGKIFVAAGKKHGVDPRLVVGISGAESGFGKHNFRPFNAWGWMSGDQYGSWEQSINVVTQGLASGYISQGLQTPAQIVSKYAPASAGNDESVWSGNVSSFMRELGASPAKAVAKMVAKTVGSPPASTVPSIKMPEPSTSGIRSALISNLGLIAQRGHGSGQGLLQSVVSGTLEDRMTDEASLAQYQEALKAVSPAEAADTKPPPAEAPADKSTGPTLIPAPGEVKGGPYAGSHTLGNWQSDNAIDVYMPTGTPVRAVADGVIGDRFGSLNSSNPAMAGLRLNLAAESNNFYYAHLSKFAEGIAPGVQVKAGQILGYSGEANGAEHLHFAQQKGDPRERY